METDRTKLANGKIREEKYRSCEGGAEAVGYRLVQTKLANRKTDEDSIDRVEEN